MHYLTGAPLHSRCNYGFSALLSDRDRVSLLKVTPPLSASTSHTKNVARAANESPSAPHSLAEKWHELVARQPGTTPELPVSKSGRLLESGNEVVVMECRSTCPKPHCKATRVVQKGIRLPIEVFRTPNGRGWGVRCRRPIQVGQFICEYVGEILTDEEAERVKQETSDGAAWEGQMGEGCDGAADRDDEPGDAYLFSMDNFLDASAVHLILPVWSKGSGTRVIESLDETAEEVRMSLEGRLKG